MKSIAIFLSCDSFEKFFGGTFGLSRDDYVSAYRNDFAWNFADGLQRLGHQVTLYVLSYATPVLRHTDDGYRVRFLPLPGWFRWADRVLYRMAQSGLWTFLRDRLAYATYADALRRALSDDGIDVLYAQEFWTPRFSILLEHLTLPIIGADHGGRPDVRLAQRQQRLFPKATVLTCQTEENLQRARARGGRAVLLPNGVDTRFFVPPQPGGARPRTILAVGRLVEKQKRFSDVIRALASLPEFSLVVAGSGPSGPELQALALQLGVAERVQFLGFVGDRLHMRRLFQECGVFVSSSAWEGLALVLLEAMSCATPIVATRMPSSETLFSDGVNGLLVPVGRPDLLAAAIRDAYAKGATLGLAARQTIESRYSAARMFEDLSGFIEQSADGSQPVPDRMDPSGPEGHATAAEI